MNYYQFPQFTQPFYPQYNQAQYAQADEQSYIENILRLNIKSKGKFSAGEIGLPMTNSKLVLPAGIYGRWEE